MLCCTLQCCVVHYKVVLYTTMWCCTLQCCVVHYSAVLYSMLLGCTISGSIVNCYATLCNSAALLNITVLYSVHLWCSIILPSAVVYTLVQHCAVLYSVVLHSAVLNIKVQNCAMRCVVVMCHTLQCCVVLCLLCPVLFFCSMYIATRSRFHWIYSGQCLTTSTTVMQHQMG